MASDDYAILVGISRYPELGENRTPVNLKGPANDVEAIADWLVKKGGVPNDKIHLQRITSKTIGGVKAKKKEPASSHLLAALKAFDIISERNVSQGLGPGVGRRLYVFMAGHGFSPLRRRGCLITADANPTQTENVDVSAWTDWFQDKGYFRELVLWMDCCMDRISLVRPIGPPAQPGASPLPAGPAFVAFAAQRPLRAVEVPVGANGAWHGAFTWALLEGLNGAAVDRHRRITGRSLADWVRNAQPALLSEDHHNDPDVSKEPDVVEENEALVFAEGVSPRSYKVTLDFPAAAVGKEARLWSGHPPQVESFRIAKQKVERKLSPGLYVVDVAEVRLRQGFEVLAPLTVTVSETGKPVVPKSGTLFTLTVRAEGEGNEIYLIDTQFSRVKGSPGRLTAKLPFGIYKIKARLGRGITERVVILDSSGPHDPLAAPRLPTAAPLMSAHMHHEFHVDAARALGRNLGAKAKAGLGILARVWSPDGTSRARPAKAIRVFDAKNKLLLDLTKSGEIASAHDTLGDAVISGSIALNPGTYYVRYETNEGTELEQSAVVVEGWVTEAHVLQPVSADGTVELGRALVSAHMRRLGPGVGVDENLYRLIETSSVALADERNVLTPELEELLFRKYDDPIAGIVGGHLVLLEADRQRRSNVDILNVVVKNLRKLVGDQHPDVEALATRCPDKRLRPKGPIAGPPMFQRSWPLLTAASEEIRGLIPPAVFERVLASATLPLFLAWTPNAELKKRSKDVLLESLFGSSGNLERPPSRARRTSPGPSGSSEAVPASAALEPSSNRSRANASRPVAIDAGTKERARQLHIPSWALRSLRREVPSTSGPRAKRRGSPD